MERSPPHPAARAAAVHRRGEPARHRWSDGRCAGPRHVVSRTHARRDACVCRRERGHDGAPRARARLLRGRAVRPGERRLGVRRADGRSDRAGRRRPTHRAGLMGAVRPRGRRDAAARVADAAMVAGVCSRRGAAPSPAAAALLCDRHDSPRRPRAPGCGDPVGDGVRGATGLLHPLRTRGARTRAGARLALARRLRASSPALP